MCKITEKRPKKRPNKDTKRLTTTTESGETTTHKKLRRDTKPQRDA